MNYYRNSNGCDINARVYHSSDFNDLFMHNPKAQKELWKP